MRSILPRELEELGLVAIEGGWRVRETERYFIDVIRMGGNWRMCTTPRTEQHLYERGWCYSRETLLAVVLRCYLFDPDGGEEPVGWVKEAGTERRACKGYYQFRDSGHAQFDPQCAQCGNARYA